MKINVFILSFLLLFSFAVSARESILEDELIMQKINRNCYDEDFYEYDEVNTNQYSKRALSAQKKCYFYNYNNDGFLKKFNIPTSKKGVYVKLRDIETNASLYTKLELDKSVMYMDLYLQIDEKKYDKLRISEIESGAFENTYLYPYINDKMEIYLISVTILEQGYRANFWKKYVIDLKNKQFTPVKESFCKRLVDKEGMLIYRVNSEGVEMVVHNCYDIKYRIELRP